MEWLKDFWWLVGLGVLGIAWLTPAIVSHNQFTTQHCTPLPPLDLTARDARVIGTRLAPRRKHRFYSWGNIRLPGDLWLIEVEYADSSGAVRRELVADVIHDDEKHRFPVGSWCRVYGFERPRGRCLLTEEHDAIPRNGFNLDKVRMRTDRQVSSARTGSPFLGVMAVETSASGAGAGTVGRRTSWPGDPASVWARSSGAPKTISRPWPAPRVEEVDQVASWVEPDKSGRPQTLWTPIRWVGVPLLVVGLLLGWTLSDLPARGLLWTAWPMVGYWLILALLAALLWEASDGEWDTERAAWILEHGVLCEVHRSPFSTLGGEGPDVPGLILIDHRLSAPDASRLVRAWREWLRSGEVQQDLHYGLMQSFGNLSSAEVFGPDAAGSYFVISEVGSAQWVLLAGPTTDTVKPTWWRSAQLIPIPEGGGR